MSKRTMAVSLSLCAALAATPRAGAQTAGAPSPAATTGPLAAGTPAPNVGLLFGGKTVALKSLLAGNRTAVIFYPAACATCDAQLQAIDAPTFQQLGQLGFAVFAVSPDSPATQAETAARLSLPYKIVSDPNGAAARAFHASGPAAFLIDRGGTVRFSSDLGRKSLAGSDLVAAAKALQRPSRAAP